MSFVLVAFKPPVGVDGATTVVWNQRTGSNSIVQASTRPAGSGTFGAVVNLSTLGQDADYQQVAVGADGATTVVWRRDNGSNSIVQASTRPAGSITFSAAENLSAAGQSADNPQVAVAVDGATTVVWDRWNGPNSIVQARTRPAGSITFGGAVNLSATGKEADNPQVAVAVDGTATVVWERDGPTYSRIQESTSSTTKLPSNHFTMSSVKVRVNALTSTVVVPGSGKLTQSVTRTAGGLTVCKTSAEATEADRVKLTCKLSTATRAALRKRSLRVSVKTTFKPTGGVLASKTKLIKLPHRPYVYRTAFTGQ